MFLSSSTLSVVDARQEYSGMTNIQSGNARHSRVSLACPRRSRGRESIYLSLLSQILRIVDVCPRENHPRAAPAPAPASPLREGVREGRGLSRGEAGVPALGHDEQIRRGKLFFLVGQFLQERPDHFQKTRGLIAVDAVPRAGDMRDAQMRHHPPQSSGLRFGDDRIPGGVGREQ